MNTTTYLCIILSISTLFGSETITLKADLALAPKDVLQEPFRFLMDWNNEGKGVLPRHFRTVEDSIAQKVDLSGYKDLRMSESGQFSENEWKAVLQTLGQKYEVNPDQIYVIDLREEPHFFINDFSVTLGNDQIKDEYRRFEKFEGVDPLSVEKFEKALTKHLKTKQDLPIYKFVKKPTHQKTGDKVILQIDMVETEKNLIEKSGAHYVRLSVTDDHRPTDPLIDSFLIFLETLPNDAWLHFHCLGGSGRTSSFALIFDMVRNGQKVPLDTLIERNVDFGGAKKLFDLSSEKAIGMEDGLARRDFLLKFYDYVRDKNGLGKTPWSKWAQQKRIRLMPPYTCKKHT